MKKYTFVLAVITLLTSLAGLAGLAGCSRRKQFEDQYESESLSEALSESLAHAEGTQADTNVIGVTPGESNVIEVVRPETNVIEVAPPETGEIGSAVETPGVGETGSVEIPNIGETGTTETSDATEPAESQTTPVAPPAYTGSLPSDRGFRLEVMEKKGDVGYYEGKTLEELSEMFTAYGRHEGGYPVLLPTGAFLSSGASWERAYYNKQTGNTSAWCPDPLCEPGECLFMLGPDFQYVSKYHIYFISEDYPNNDFAEYLWRCDVQRNHIEKLMPIDKIIHDYEEETDEEGNVVSGSYSAQTGFEKIYFADRDTLYMSKLVYRDSDVGKECYGTFDCNSKEFTLIPAAEDMTILGITGEDTVWCYREVGGRREYYHADLHFTKVERATEVEALLTGKDMKVVVASDIYLEIMELREDRLGYVIIQLYNVQTGKTIDVEALFGNLHDWVFSGNFIYYQKVLSDEEIAASHLKDYYTHELTEEYKFPDGTPTGQVTTYWCPNRDGGRIFRMNLETGEEELILQLTYNDIPVWIYNFKIDGESCYMTYATYDEYYNFYNQDIDPMTSRRPYVMHCAVADFSNGTLRFVEWYEEE